MARASISAYSATQTSNTLITDDSTDISIAEGWPAANINGSIRTLMTHLADAYAGDSAYDSVTNSVSAGSTQTQAGATALTTTINRVTTVGTSGDGVKLPTAVAGLQVLIINDDSAQTLKVWPNTSDGIDGGSANAVDSNQVSAGASRLYIAVDATNWYTALNDLGSIPLGVTSGGTGAATFTDGGILLGSGTGAVTATAVLTDGQVLVGDGSGDPVAESGATLRSSLGLGTGDSPTFTTVTASTSVIPDAAGGADLGSTSAEWGDVYIADDKAIKLGNDQDVTISYDEAGLDTTRVVAAGGVTMSPHGTSSGNTTEMRFLELAANGNNYTGFKAPDSVTGTSVYQMPPAYPASSKVLQSTDAGILSWEAAGGFTLAATDDLRFTASTLTLSSGAATGTGSRHVIAAQSGTTDDFDTLATTNYAAGSLVFLTADAGDIIHITNAGNFSETWVLSETEPATFMLIGSTWYQIDRKINANLADNGGFMVAQRGATITSPTGTKLTLDRWKYSDQSGAGRVTITQSTTVPNRDFTNSLKIDVTTVDSSIAAGDLYRIYQYGLGLDCGHIAAGAAGAKDITISFWWRSDSSALSYPAIFCGTFGNGNEARVYPFEFSQTTNATWQFHVVTIPGDTTGTWVRTNAKSCYMAINLAVGSDWHGTNKTWSANYDYSTSNQVNGMGHTGNDFYLAGYKAEIGPIATPFQHRPYAEEELICFKYTYKWTPDEANASIGVGWSSGTTEARCDFQLPTNMRTNNGATLETSGTATDYRINVSATTNACNAVPTLNHFAGRSAQLVFGIASANLVNDEAANCAAATTDGFLLFEDEI